MADKPLQWVGSSLKDLRAFPATPLRQAGHQLRRVQQGLPPDDWRPMPTVGSGVVEIQRPGAQPQAACRGSPLASTWVAEVPMARKVRRSTGNVFRDLGFGTAESENLRLRSELMIELSKLIKARGLTQAKAAALFGVTQPRISDLVRGRIERFSVDMLVAMLGSAGARVELVVRPRSRVA